MRDAVPEVAMVLAAGRGVRMRPLSDCLPKPALPLPGGPVIAWPLDVAARAGARRVVVNAWHLADRLQQTLEELTGGYRPQLCVSRERALMGTAGGLAVAREAGLLGVDGPLLVLNGDGVVDLDLEPALARHHTSSDLVTLALLPHPDPVRWSRVLLDDDGCVQRILPAGRPEPGERPYVYPGAMVVAREALAGLPAAPGEVPAALWEPARRTGRLGAAVVSGDWREVGTPADYLTAVLEHLGGDAAVHPTARVHPTAVVEEALIGRGARVEAGAEVRGSVVAEAAVVGHHSRVARSLLLGPLRLPPRSVLHGETRAAPC